MALGVKKTLGHVDEPLETIPSVALFGGMAIYYAGHLGFRLRNVGTLNRPRLVAALVCLALIPRRDRGGRDRRRSRSPRRGRRR